MQVAETEIKLIIVIERSLRSRILCVAYEVGFDFVFPPITATINHKYHGFFVAQLGASICVYVYVCRNLLEANSLN